MWRVDMNAIVAIVGRKGEKIERPRLDAPIGRWVGLIGGATNREAE